MDPVLFWGMFAIVLIVIGTMLRDVFNSFYFTWKAKRSYKIQRTTPSQMRESIRRAHVVIARLQAEGRDKDAKIGALLSENASQRGEIKTLLSRNIMQANELRCDEAAKTQLLPYRWHPYRQWDEIDVEPDSDR